MYRLEATHRCDLFEQLAELIWDDVAEHHQEDVHLFEAAITNQIIALTRKNHRNKNIAIWANNGLSESKFGSDIDIFIESEVNRFHWFALQSKILTKNGFYLGINNKKQWEKLDKLKGLSGCLPFFLFYNGFANKVLYDIESCSREVSEKQFGCSIIQNDRMEGLMKDNPNPKYEDFHPDYAKPWRELVCCTYHRKSGQIYTLEQVRNAVVLYDNIANSEMIERGLNSNNLQDDNNTAITRANTAVERQPKLSLVIRTTNGINQPKQM